MKDNWIYIGAFLDEESKQQLADHLITNGIFIPDGWTRYMHHMTICFNRHDESSESMYDAYAGMFGQSVTLDCCYYGITSDVIAIAVDTNMLTQNSQPHVTIATAPGVPPVKSNEIANWKKMPSIRLSAVIGEFTKKPKKS